MVKAAKLRVSAVRSIGLFFEDFRPVTGWAVPGAIRTRIRAYFAKIRLLSFRPMQFGENNFHKYIEFNYLRYDPKIRPIELMDNMHLVA